MRRSRLTHVTLALCMTLACVALVPSVAGAGGQNPSPRAPNPLKGQDWWDQNTPYNLTWNGYRSLMRSGRRGDAAKVRLLAETPQFRWWGQWEDPVVSKLRGMFSNAGDSVPLLAVFGDQPHGCASRGTHARYKRWIDKFARGVGRNEVVLAFEPDSLGLASCAGKFAALRYGVRRLSRLPNATVYLEAGSAGWMSAGEAASKLRRIGVRAVRGFMLNATHMFTTKQSIRHGLKISRRLGGKHFIINTSHNGNGQLFRGGSIVWCNPPNAAAGALPTTKTAHRKVDAYMWVERPGFSNGACNGGPSRVGAWWGKRAIQMVARAKWYRR